MFEAQCKFEVKNECSGTYWPWIISNSWWITSQMVPSFVFCYKIYLVINKIKVTFVINGSKYMYEYCKNYMKP
jgi:hypothetical protein